MNRLFVYGTLRKGSAHPMQARLAAHAEHLGAACIAGDLYDLGPYPGLFVPASQGGSVRGDLYELNAATAAAFWDELDRYEGCSASQPEPHQYRRAKAEVVLDSGERMLAFVYVLRNRPAAAALVLSGDWNRRGAAATE
ncbi:MAG TPA: gamma-glutamylcyclotransferase family protein [Planctomycetia bacterium]|nr:gamma-glutamylcyclotransferase family protein [Planctomycetia bacterium]